MMIQQRCSARCSWPRVVIFMIHLFAPLFPRCRELYLGVIHSSVVLTVGATDYGHIIISP
jgi:hypothetical protein